MTLQDGKFVSANSYNIIALPTNELYIKYNCLSPRVRTLFYQLELGETGPSLTGFMEERNENTKCVPSFLC